MRPKSAARVALESRIVDAFRRARAYGAKDFRAIYLKPKDRRAFGVRKKVDGVPVRDGKRSSLYSKQGVEFAI